MKSSWFADLVVLSLIASVAACKSSQPPPAPPSVSGGSGQPSGGTVSTPAPATATSGQPGGMAPGVTERVASRCPANQTVSSDDLAEVGGALVRAYRAALKGNNPEAFEEFQAAFQPDADRNHLKTQIFPRVVEHVGKYVAGPSDPSITLCRVEKQTPERVKVFVQSRDPRKSDPPSLLVLRDGKWLLDSMTP